MLCVAEEASRASYRSLFGTACLSARAAGRIILPSGDFNLTAPDNDSAYTTRERNQLYY
jgi:hypothetical protein